MWSTVQLDSYTSLQAPKRSGRKRARSPADSNALSGSPPGKKRHNAISEKPGGGRSLASKSTQSTDSKELQNQIQQQTVLLESLRIRQEACRPLVLRLAAVERCQVLDSCIVINDPANSIYFSQNILTNWPHRFVDAVSALTGERGGVVLPAAFCTSAENHRTLQRMSSPQV